MPMICVAGRVVPQRRLTIEPREAAELLRCDPRVIRNMFRRGELSDVSLDRRRRADPVEVLELIERRTAAGELTHMALVDFARLVGSPG
jgi:hypothetical protein